jgi:hypothetical protein
VALRFEGLFLGKEFLNGIVRHVDYDAIARKAPWCRTTAKRHPFGYRAGAISRSL